MAFDMIVTSKMLALVCDVLRKIPRSEDPARKLHFWNRDTRFAKPVMGLGRGKKMNNLRQLQIEDVVCDLTNVKRQHSAETRAHICDFLNDTMDIVFPPDTRSQVTDTTQYPFNAIGQLVVKFPNGKTYTSTATLIDETHVLTAAHNVYGADIGGQATQVFFIPARNGDKMPYGYVAASKFFFPRAYKDLNLPSPLENDGAIEGFSHYENDFAVVRLKKPVVNPSLPMGVPTDEQLEENQASLSGYSSDKPKGTMWTAHGAVTTEDYGLITHKIDTFMGGNGSSLVMKFDEIFGLTIAGIHVASSSDQKCSVAVRLTRKRLIKILEWTLAP